MPNFLSDYNQPTINSVQARLVLANEILKNIGQNIIENDGEGVTQRFSKDTKSARINVIRVLPLTQEARVYGADYNGQPFAISSLADYDQPQTVQYGLDVITIIDKPIAIRNTMKDMIPVDLLEAETQNFSLLVWRNINAMTIAGKMVKSLENYVEVDLTGTGGTEVRDAFILANSKLDEGDSSNGVDMFPIEDRIAVIRTSMRPELLKAQNILVGGSNYAQDILAKGTLDTSSTRDQRNGYIGTIDGIPVYMANNTIWSLAEKYLGWMPGEADNILGYISSGMANARGIALDETIKIVDAVHGPGILIQPDCRMGFEAFYTKGNVFLVKKDATLPNTTRKLLAPGSRYKPTVTLSAESGTSAPTATVGLGTSRTLADGKYFYGDGTVALTHVAFEAGYAAASKKGTISAVGGTALTQTGVSAKYVYVKIVDDLGNVTIKKSTGTYTLS